MDLPIKKWWSSIELIIDIHSTGLHELSNNVEHGWINFDRFSEISCLLYLVIFGINWICYRVYHTNGAFNNGTWWLNNGFGGNYTIFRETRIDYGDFLEDWWLSTNQVFKTSVCGLEGVFPKSFRLSLLKSHKNPSFDGSMSSIPPVLVLIPLIFDD